jgi:hypothetical protein
MVTPTPENDFQLRVMVLPTPKMILGAGLAATVPHIFLRSGGKIACC